MNTKPKQLLPDVVVIRNILIVLLVFYHAFAIYSGAWKPIDGFPEIKAYWWLDKLSFAFMLELFVFVSGYVFGFQVRIKGDSKLQAKNLFWGKFKRLIIPSIIFSLLYILLLGNIRQPIQKTVYDLLNGYAHMWFLPMLYWCFVGVWIIEKIHLKSKWAILLLVVATMGSFLPLPLRIGEAMYYMLFFYIGYIIQKDNISLSWLFNKRSAILTTLIFIILFPILTLLKEHIGLLLEDDDFGRVFVFRYVLNRLFQLLYVFAGITMTLSLVGCFLKHHTYPGWMDTIGKLSFGVYLFQQFILKGIYDYTMLPSLLGCYWLPWVGFIIAMVGSIIISLLFIKTKTGRFLIG